MYVFGIVYVFEMEYFTRADSVHSSPSWLKGKLRFMAKESKPELPRQDGGRRLAPLEL